MSVNRVQLQLRGTSGPTVAKTEVSKEEVKIAYDSFVQNREVLSWNLVIREKITKADNGHFYCRNCDFSHAAQHFVIDHIEMNHLPNFPGYRCTICHLLFQTWFIFKNHVKGIHCSNISFQRREDSIPVVIPTSDILPFIVKRGKLAQPQPRKAVSILKSKAESVSLSILRKSGPGDDATYMCKFCVFSDPDQDTVQAHVSEKHTTKKEHFTNELADKEDYTCDTCRFVSPNQTNYIEHKRRAHKQIVKPYKCDLCEYRCLRRARLISHLAMKHNLLSSQRRTRIDKPRSSSAFKCSKCDYLGSSSSDLKVHDYKHHFIKQEGGLFESKEAVMEGGKKYHCQYCLRSCLSQEALTDHEMTHGGVHAYNCELCNKGFRQRIRWITHMERYHEVQVQVSPVKRGIVTCQYCARDFPFKKTLTEHMIEAHGVRRHSNPLPPQSTDTAPVHQKLETLDETSHSMQVDNFVAAEVENVSLTDASLTDDMEDTLAENIVDYGIFAPDPLTVDCEVDRCEEEDKKNELVQTSVEDFVQTIENLQNDF